MEVPSRRSRLPILLSKGPGELGKRVDAVALPAGAPSVNGRRDLPNGGDGVFPDPATGLLLARAK